MSLSTKTIPPTGTAHLMDNFDLESVWTTGPARVRNGQLGTGDGNCLVCNRRMPMNDPRNASVHMTVDGDLFPANEDHDDDPDSQGWFEIGSSCVRKIPAAYRSMPREHRFNG